MNPTRAAAVVASLLVLLPLGRSSADGPEDITAATVDALRSWVVAVRSHTPGRADDPVVKVANFSYRTREDLNAGLRLFLDVLAGKVVVLDLSRSGGAEKTILAIGHEAGIPDAGSFLRRAAVLHADVAAYGDRFPVPVTSAAKETPPDVQELRFGSGTVTPMRLQRDEPAPPLLTQSRLVLNQDGQVLGEVTASWNWPFARSLLDLVPPGPAKDPFVAAWYRATAAYMFASGAFGDLTPHLDRAARLFPDDARVLFDRGCYAEILGLPMHQALISERDVVAGRLGGRGPGASAAWSASTWQTPGSAAPLRIPPAERTNAEAERLFRRALGIDPRLVEARVRLARLLELRKRHNEAATELSTALAGNPPVIVAFYAHLFAGRVAQAMGQADEASRRYHDALALFPDAQSALLASSQLALAGSDISAALSPVARLGERSAVSTADPWWQYHLCAGRDAEELLRALWASVPRPSSDQPS